MTKTSAIREQVYWENIKTFFQFPDEIRRIIYTTNAVESLHRHFRKAIKTRSIFPTDESLLKILFLKNGRCQLLFFTKIDVEKGSLHSLSYSLTTYFKVHF